MPTRCKVVLFGDSLVLTGVGQSLERYPHLEVITLDASNKHALRDLDALCPAAIILDLCIVTTDFAFSLLDERPDLLLICLDPGGNGMLVFSGQQARRLTVANLARLIDSSLPMQQGEETAAESTPNGWALPQQDKGPSSDLA